MNKPILQEQLENFYKVNRLGREGGNADSYVKIDITPKFRFYFPNFEARRKAVMRHDIHHLVTEYPTTILGEGEISAWEIASDCRQYWAAFVLDLSGVLIGVLFGFRKVLKAFARGRHTENIYHDHIPMEQALAMDITELKQKLKLDIYAKDTKPTVTDILLFLFLLFFAAIYWLLTLPLLPFVIIYSIGVELKLRNANKAN